MKMRLLYILYCPPPPLQRDGKDLSIPWPFYMCRFTAPPPPILSSYWLAHWPITQSRFWPPRGEGGDQYNTTTCRMAEGSKDPCISRVDASHGEWPRIESSLLFCNFFYIVKIIYKGGSILLENNFELRSPDPCLHWAIKCFASNVVDCIYVHCTIQQLQATKI